MDIEDTVGVMVELNGEYMYMGVRFKVVDIDYTKCKLKAKRVGGETRGRARTFWIEKFELEATNV